MLGKDPRLSVCVGGIGVPTGFMQRFKLLKLLKFPGLQRTA
jgi:hypothetical protein